jgi:hypothetical protein
VKVKKIDNKEAVMDIMRAIIDNGGYCPCIVKKSPDTKCMCKAFRESPVGTTCLCGLYIKTVF